MNNYKYEHHCKSLLIRLYMCHARKQTTIFFSNTTFNTLLQIIYSINIFSITLTCDKCITLISQWNEYSRMSNFLNPLFIYIKSNLNNSWFGSYGNKYSTRVFVYLPKLCRLIPLTNTIIWIASCARCEWYEDRCKETTHIYMHE